jgi:RND family efflux transporter MFP subunit
MPYRELDVASEIGGVLAAVRVEEGEEVREGQVLVQFKDEVLQARLAVSEERVKAAKVDIAAQKASFDILNTEHERTKSLTEKGVMTDKDLNRAKLEMELARFKLESATAAQRVYELTAAFDKTGVDQTIVCAPIAGQVFRVLKRAGEAVEPQNPVIKMVSVDPLYVIGYAPIATSGRIRVGMKATLTLENMADRRFETTVEVVDKVADAASGTYRVKLRLPNPDRTITAGAKGTVTFNLSG